MSQSNFSGPIYSEDGFISPSGQGISSGGTITAGATIQGTVVKATTGFYSEAGNVKAFSAGTYIGTGGATAAIISTGLTTITGVWMQLNKQTYSAATTGMAYGRPCRAHGTLGSFYPIAFKTGTIGGGGPVLNTVAGTFAWYAVGAA